MNPTNYGPDWTAAPTWATWWACDQDGEAFWFEHEPGLGQKAWFTWGGKAKLAGIANTHLIDWRTSVGRPGTDATGVRLRSMTTFDAYVYLKPPIELIEHLERYEAKGTLPAPVQAYLNNWRNVRSDYTAGVVELPTSAHVGDRERVLA